MGEPRWSVQAGAPSLAPTAGRMNLQMRESRVSPAFVDLPNPYLRFIDKKNSSLVLVSFSLSRRNSMAAIS
ncbi:hypothetical protein, partial [Pseudomonas kuykendallii]|uniref:hypothetical protein n=1 Tax=Pseudomonas kuykendallii TaxID=1007099 RepID=UPI0036F370D3